ncbi:DNA/RNA-binding domain of Phe-tRNA-synthetase-like protein [Bacillus ectoiniformans]|uniref:B3/B4 domain-containing protein n=1 Tax=Bacillus ectoiniformans TaxID=1494429 RepID=UPI001959D112|nr:phenylalanine--tRNA ligase beta subunit-related protein [Bacillus ectoiniformans]MBM7647515.1 DNA/RNA-binding domain of Phe-tRNA-synthetase-like protein [Bacillus ectoiniformans]
MNISLHSDILNHPIPLSFGVIYYENIVVADSPQMLKGRLRLFQESLFFDLQEKPVTEFEGIKEWRSLFKSLGKDPNRYRPSVESLFRRIKKQHYMESQHSAVDLNNFFSLQYQSPIGLYDQKSIQGNVSIRLGADAETYEGLNGRMNGLHHLLVTADELGPFGSPFVDSVRTAVTTNTTHAFQMIYLRPGLPKDEQSKLTESLMNMFLQIHGGTGTFEILTNQY